MTVAHQHDDESISSVDEITVADIDDGDFTAEDLPTGYTIEGKAQSYESKDTRKARFRERLNAGRQRRRELEPAAASTGIPKIDEWMTFFSHVLIRTATDFVIDMAFRGIDEALLTDREINSIRLTDEERDRIAKPFAEFAYKNRFARKHGREIIATAGSIDSLLQLGLWYTRVARLASKYRKIQNGEYVPNNFQMRTTRPPESPVHEPAEQMPQRPQPQPASGVNDERSGQSTQAQHNGHDRNWRPPIAGNAIYNPGG